MYLFRSQKKICISFDWHHDRSYRYMLSAWSANSRNPLVFEDLTPSEIDTNAIDRIKAVLTRKIRAATHTLVIVGAHANTRHRDSAKIGAPNWIWWEIEQSKAEGNKLIAVKIDRSYAPPGPLLNANASWAQSFTQDSVLRAINAA